MTGLVQDQERLGALVLAVARIMPSAAAAPHASLEWRVARVSWLKSLADLGWEEDLARSLAADIWTESMSELVAAAEPVGRA